MTKQGSEVLEPHLQRLLSAREHPKTLCPSEVARTLSKSELNDIGASSWRELMPAIRQLVWDLRAKGQVEVLQKGEVLSDSVALTEVRGPIRVRKVAQSFTSRSMKISSTDESIVGR